MKIFLILEFPWLVDFYWIKAIVKILEENNNFFQVLKNLIQNQKSPACFQDLILSFSQIIKMIFCE